MLHKGVKPCFPNFSLRPKLIFWPMWGPCPQILNGNELGHNQIACRNITHIHRMVCLFDFLRIYNDSLVFDDSLLPHSVILCSITWRNTICLPYNFLLGCSIGCGHFCAIRFRRTPDRKDLFLSDDFLSRAMSEALIFSYI